MRKIFRKQKPAFTLAEVLITLGVIGVVAGVTLPTLIQNHQKNVTVNRLKVTYSTIYNAFKRAEVDYGDMKNWQMEEDPEQFAEKYLKPYLKIADEFDNEAITYKMLNGQISSNGRVYKHYMLSNGAGFSLAYCSACRPVEMTVMLDINGLGEPNRIGFDAFNFKFTEGNGFQPGCISRDREVLKTGVSSWTDKCSVDNGGNCCGALIIADGWKISDDYPWKNK